MRIFTRIIIALKKNEEPEEVCQPFRASFHFGFIYFAIKSPLHLPVKRVQFQTIRKRTAVHTAILFPIQPIFFASQQSLPSPLQDVTVGRVSWHPCKCPDTSKAWSVTMSGCIDLRGHVHDVGRVDPSQRPLVDAPVDRSNNICLFAILS
jgi:hypothetical protein